MEIQDKLMFLKSLNTKSLVDKLKEREDSLEKAMRDDASFKDLNHGFLASGTNDSQAVKQILAALSARAPENNEDGKKTTIADREAWLSRQRTEDTELSGAINRQKGVAFNMENNQISIDMSKRRLEGTKAVLSLKTAQINLIAS